MPPFEDRPLRRSRTHLSLLVFAAAGCSAAGLELENYGFYGATPTPDGARLKQVTVAERVSRTLGPDTTVVAEGEFRLDTARVDGERVWLATRRSIDAGGQPVLDSIWMDRYTLRTIRSVQRDRNGVTELEFNRRVVRSVRITPDGRRQTWRGMHQAEPYGLLGIEIVLGALPLRLGTAGTLPVAGGMGDVEQQLRFEVVDHTQEPRQVAGGVVYRPVWLVQARLGRDTFHFWVDPEDRAVVRRTVPGPENSLLVVARGPAVPSIRLAPVEPLGGGSDRNTRVIRPLGGSQPSNASP